MKKETYYVEEHSQYEIASQEDYEGAMAEMKANCAKALRLLCEMWYGVEIYDSDIYYDEEDGEFPGTGYIKACVSIEASENAEAYNNLLSGLRMLFGKEKCGKGHLEASCSQYHVPLLCFDIDDEEIFVWCISDIVEDISEEE